MYWNNVAYVESALHIEECYKSQFLDSLKWHLVYCNCRFKPKAFKWSIRGSIFIAVSTPATAGVWPGPHVQLWWLWWPGSDYVNTDPLSTGQGKLGPAPRHPGSSPVHWHGPRPGGGVMCGDMWYPGTTAGHLFIGLSVWRGVWLHGARCFTSHQQAQNRIRNWNRIHSDILNF